MTPALVALFLLVLKTSLILAGARLLAALLRRRGASMRNVVLQAGMIAALLVPVIAFLVPAWRVPVWAGASAAGPAGDNMSSLVQNAAGAPVLTTAGDASAMRSAPAVPTHSVTPVAPLMHQAAAAGTARATPEPTMGATPKENERASAIATEGMRARVEVATSGALLTRLALVVYGTGVLAVLLPFVAAVRARRRLLRNAMHGLPPAWAAVLSELWSRYPVLPQVRVVTADTEVPMTWGIWRPVVVLPASCSWSDAERRAALVHELAHVERRDAAANLIARVLCAVYWFNPLSWQVAGAEQVSREQACDDAVLRGGATPSEYAQQLLEVAGLELRNTRAAALPMARASRLAVRLRAILDARTHRHTRSRGAVLVTAAATVLLAVPLAAFKPVARARLAWVTPDFDRRPATVLVLAPALVRVGQVAPPAALATPQPALCPVTGKKQGRSVSITSHSDSDRNTQRVQYKHGDCSLELVVDGKFTLSDDATDIVLVERGSRVDIRMDDGRETRTLKLTNDGGTLARDYQVNRKAASWDADATRWLAATLLLLDRQTGFAIDKRYPYLMRIGGVDRVIDETSLSTSDYVHRLYLGRLLKRERLTALQLARVVTVARAMESDYERAELLLVAASQPSLDAASARAFAEITTSMSSDYEKRRALGALLAGNAMSPDVVQTMLGSAATMHSDYELAELLVKMGGRFAIDDSTRRFYLRALGNIDSDYELGRVLSTLVSSGNVSPPILRDLLAVSGTSMTGYELAQFLVKVAERYPLEGETKQAFEDAAARVRSDYEYGRVMAAARRRR